MKGAESGIVIVRAGPQALDILLIEGQEVSPGRDLSSFSSEAVVS